MAEIDKTLPNVKQTVNIPGPEEIEIAEQEELAQQQEAGPPVETTENEDGSVDVNFNPTPDKTKDTSPTLQNYYPTTLSIP